MKHKLDMVLRELHRSENSLARDLLDMADRHRVHRKAAGVSMDWELLGQAAQSLRERDLLELSKRCHPQTLRQMRWANGMLKTVAPQVLSS